MKPNLKNIVLHSEDFLAKGLKIGITVDDIMAEFNAFDWLDLHQTPSEQFYENFKKRLNFTDTEPIKQKAFAYKFERALKNLSALIEEVHASYNIPQKGNAANNKYIEQYYYLKYWADKKRIPVNYNETDYEKRKLFNLYTILFDIFAEKLTNYNAFHANKP